MLSASLNKTFLSLSHLANRNETAEDDGPKTNPKHSIDEKPAKETQDDVGPGIPGVELHELALVEVKVSHHRILKSSWVIVTEVAACN